MWNDRNERIATFLRNYHSMKLSFGYSRISESIDLTFRRQSAYFNDVFENAEACLEKNSREPSDMRFAKPEEVLVA